MINFNDLTLKLAKEGKYLLNIDDIYYVINEDWNTLTVGTLQEIYEQYMKV